MTPAIILQAIIRPALLLLPTVMASREAERMLLAISIYETGLESRSPVGGWWDLDEAGYVLRHPETSGYASQACRTLAIDPVEKDAKLVLRFNDVLAAVFARLLLWTLSAPLPGARNQRGAWDQYVEAWRPRRLRGEQWPLAWEEARQTAAKFALPTTRESDGLRLVGT